MDAQGKKQIAEIMSRHGVVVGYLFGSVARGTAGPHSDIDLMVLFDGKFSSEERFDEKMKIMDEVGDLFKIDAVDVISVADATDPLIKYVALSSGELVLERDKKARVFVEKRIVRDYEDTRELRRIGRMVMRNQLRDGTFGKMNFVQA